MGKRLVAALVLGLGLSVMTANADPGKLAIGYDEGLAARMQIIPKLFGHASLNYQVSGADTVGDQPLQNFFVKLGGSYELLGDETVNLSGFGEYGLMLQQYQAKETLTGDEFSLKRYNSLDNIIRGGAALQWTPTKHLAFIYRMGLEYRSHGEHFKLNGSRSDTETLDDGYSEFRVYGSPMRAGRDNDASLGEFLGSPLHNLSIYFVF